MSMPLLSAGGLSKIFRSFYADRIQAGRIIRKFEIQDIHFRYRNGSQYSDGGIGVPAVDQFKPGESQIVLVVVNASGEKEYAQQRLHGLPPRESRIFPEVC